MDIENRADIKSLAEVKSLAEIDSLVGQRELGYFSASLYILMLSLELRPNLAVL